MSTGCRLLDFAQVGAEADQGKQEQELDGQVAHHVHDGEKGAPVYWGLLFSFMANGLMSELS